jgi:hypothetical protein
VNIKLARATLFSFRDLSVLATKFYMLPKQTSDKIGHKNLATNINLGTRTCNYVSSFFQRYYVVAHINIIPHDIFNTVGHIKK